MADPITPDQVLRYLRDVDYPADKEALVTAADRARAPEAVVRSVRAIPPVEYRNRAAEQARTHAASGVAEHMQEPR